MNKEFSIVGLGNMGSALTKAALEEGFRVFGFDIQKEAMEKMKIIPNFIAKNSLDELLLEKRPLVLAVKPMDIGKVVEEISDERLVISIAAGVSLNFLQKKRKSQGANIRAMPNLCTLAKKGATVLCPDSLCTLKDVQFAQSIFQAVGICDVVKEETLLDAVTALSGSGPAYVYLFLQTLEDAAVREGLPRELSRKLAKETVLGALALWQREAKELQTLIAEISSPGGTTIEALAKLKEKGFETAIYEAIRIATEKSRFLGQKYS